MAEDLQENMDMGAGGPATHIEEVTPSDSEDLGFLSRALYVGGEGDVSVVPQAGDETVTFVGVPAGTVLPIRAHRVRSTDTTATDIVALA